MGVDGPWGLCSGTRILRDCTAEIVTGGAFEVTDGAREVTLLEAREVLCDLCHHQFLLSEPLCVTLLQFRFLE